MTNRLLYFRLRVLSLRCAMEKYGCLISGVILCLFTTLGLRWSLRGVYEDIRRFPFKYQVALMAAIGAIFCIIIGALSIVDAEKYLSVCRGLLIGEMVIQIAYNVALSCIHRRCGVRYLTERILDLGFDPFSDPIVVRRELMRAGDRAYSVNDVANALNAMKKNIK